MMKTKMNWNVAVAQLFSEPGKLKQAHCAICGSRMKARRKVLASTCLGEGLGGIKRLCDHFSCPRIGESWHEKIVDLKMEVYREHLKLRPGHRKSLHLPPVPTDAEVRSVEKLKRAAEKEILRLLKQHTAR